MTTTISGFDPAAWTTTTWIERVARDLSAIEGNGTWTVEYPTERYGMILAWLNGPCGMRIALQSGYGLEGRVRFQPCPPSYDDRNGTLRPQHVAMPKAITVAMGRDPYTVSRDVTRRLLPDYRKAVGRFALALGQAETELAHKNRTRMRLEGALDGLRWIEHARKLVTFGNGVSAEFAPGSDGSKVDIELRWVPTDLAIAIAETVQRYNETET